MDLQNKNVKNVFNHNVDHRWLFRHCRSLSYKEIKSSKDYSTVWTEEKNHG